MKPKEYARYDAVGLADLIRSKQASRQEVLSAAVQVMEALEPELNALIYRRFENPPDDQPNNAPFFGVPLLIKDYAFRQRGFPLTYGNQGLARQGDVAKDDTWLGAAFRRLGFVTLGVSSCPEFGMQSASQPQAYGATGNPYDPSRTPGGSSGGAAAAVAAGYVPFAHGNDGGGSIRVPAGWTATIGLKPSRGRVLADEHAVDFTTTNLGLAKSVRDLAAVLEALVTDQPTGFFQAPGAGGWLQSSQRDPSPLRIGMVTSITGIDVENDCIKAVQDTATILQSLGHHIEPVSFAPFEIHQLQSAMATIVLSGIRRVASYVEACLGRPMTAEDAEPYAWMMLQYAPRFTAQDLHNAWCEVQAWSRQAHQAWHTDLLLTPTSYEPAPKIAQMYAPADNPVAAAEQTARHCAFLQPFNLTGSPAISLPMGMTKEGLPVGIQLVARMGREDLLLAVAGQLERAKAFQQPTPTLHAQHIQ